MIHTNNKSELPKILMIFFGKLKSFGGIILKDKTKKIICKNTLDLRTEMAFYNMLPEIRKMCFD